MKKCYKLTGPGTKNFTVDGPMTARDSLEAMALLTAGLDLDFDCYLQGDSCVFSIEGPNFLVDLVDSSLQATADNFGMVLEVLI